MNLFDRLTAWLYGEVLGMSIRSRRLHVADLERLQTRLAEEHANLVDGAIAIGGRLVEIEAELEIIRARLEVVRQSAGGLPVPRALQRRRGDALGSNPPPTCHKPPAPPSPPAKLAEDTQ